MLSFLCTCLHDRPFHIATEKGINLHHIPPPHSPSPVVFLSFVSPPSPIRFSILLALSLCVYLVQLIYLDYYAEMLLTRCQLVCSRPNIHCRIGKMANQMQILVKLNKGKNWTYFGRLVGVQHEHVSYIMRRVCVLCGLSVGRWHTHTETHTE